MRHYSIVRVQLWLFICCSYTTWPCSTLSCIHYSLHILVWGTNFGPKSGGLGGGLLALCPRAAPASIRWGYNMLPKNGNGKKKYIRILTVTVFVHCWENWNPHVSFYDMSSRASLVCPSILNTVAAIWDGVRPASASWSAGEPCSMYRSGRTSGLHCKMNFKKTQNKLPGAEVSNFRSILFTVINRKHIN